MEDATILCANPLVLVIDNFFDKETADHIFDLTQNAFERARVIKRAVAKEDDSRTNQQSVINQWADPIATALFEKISGVVRLPPENAEPGKVLYYRKEERFTAHRDGFSLAQGHVDQWMSGGQRLFTTLAYLNDVESGGETEFPALKISVKPKLGRLLVFANTVPGTNEVHPHSLHAGNSTGDGIEKKVLATWWRENMYHVPRTYPEEDGVYKIV